MSQYYPSGKKKLVGKFKDGKLHGTEKQWYESGGLDQIVYRDGEMTGDQKFWDESG